MSVSLGTIISKILKLRLSYFCTTRQCSKLFEMIGLWGFSLLSVAQKIASRTGQCHAVALISTIEKLVIRGNVSYSCKVQSSLDFTLSFCFKKMQS